VKLNIVADTISLTFAGYVRWSTDESGLALAVITSSGIRANRRRSTGIVEAFVHIHALSAEGFEAVLAEALALDALGIVDAIEIRFAERSHVGLGTMPG